MRTHQIPSPQGGLVEGLRERIREMERPGGCISGRRGLSSGLRELDHLLADDGFTRGTLVEWITPGEGAGVAAFAASVAGHLLGIEGFGIVIDGEGEFYPVAAADLGLPLERLILVRPNNPLDALWAWEQSLRCPGVALTFGRLDRLDDRNFRRLQLAAEAGGGLGFLIRPSSALNSPSWAATRLAATSVVDGSPDPSIVADRRSPLRSKGDPRSRPVARSGDRATTRNSESRLLRLRAVRGQRDSREAFIEVEAPDEESFVPVVSELADPAAAGEEAVDRL